MNRKRKKRTTFALPLLLAAMLLPLGAAAQEVTITLSPGWTWVSYPRADTLDVTTALQSIPPTDGDQIKSQDGFSMYMNGYWIGSLHQLLPGKGLMYQSMNPETVSFVFGAEPQSPNIPTSPTGTICGKFTVNANGDQVYFSQGNLQYQASTNIWRFAENQWDYVGGVDTYEDTYDSGTVYENGVKCDNTLISSTYSGWIDLFGWGTSGYNHGAVCYQPWSISENEGDYYVYGNSEYNLYDQSGQADWGYNAISNGGNLENSGWRTLTQPEWNFVLNTRTTISGMRWVHARVNDVEGLIILPDDWSNTIYTLNANGSSWNNIITAVDWTDVLEANGAVFLPGAYLRQIANQFWWWGYDMYGNYWSSSSNGISASFVNFTFGEELYMSFSMPRYAGLSVRLVRNAE